jgi:L,D-transpeptidase YbiS
MKIRAFYTKDNPLRITALNQKIRIFAFRILSYISGIRRSTVRKTLWIIFSIYVIAGLPLLVRQTLHQFTRPSDPGYSQENPVVEQKTAEIEKKLNQTCKKLDSKTPRSAYLVINSSSNEFSLYRGSQAIKSGKCSTGSYVLLKNGEDQQWMFKTPKGEFRIQGKTTSPVWRKPDWAFVEEGLPVPSQYHYSRYEYGVLGDYALSLGDGYFIHGTLYQRFLGLPVTHGCVRLGDEDLELVYRSLPVGSKVYIY